MDKNELKAAYKHQKTDMGVFAYKCKASGKAYIGCGQDIKGDTNSIAFRLNLGSLNSKCGLQNDWKMHGESGFELIVLERLEYDKDESKTDYSADLAVLKELCTVRFSEYEFI